MKLLLIDGDIVRYRCGFAGQKTHYHMYRAEDVIYNKEEDSYQFSKNAEKLGTFENAKDAKTWVESMLGEEAPNQAHEYTRVPEVKLEPVANTLHSVKRVMTSLCERYPEYHPCVYVSCPTEDNWRYEFYPEYKANRKLQRKPFYAYEIDKYMRSKWDVIDDPHYEADDLIAMQAYENRLSAIYDNDYEYVVASIDKDLLQIPGKHWNWVKEEETDVNDMQALRLLAAQRIHGDSTDNIKGIPGWGEKTAAEWLAQSPYVDMEDMVMQAYLSATDRAGDAVFALPSEATYHVRLTEALVTLPINQEHRDKLVRMVNDAREAYETAKAAGGHTGERNGGTQ